MNFDILVAIVMGLSCYLYIRTLERGMDQPVRPVVYIAANIMVSTIMTMVGMILYLGFKHVILYFV